MERQEISIVEIHKLITTLLPLYEYSNFEKIRKKLGWNKDFGYEYLLLLCFLQLFGEIVSISPLNNEKILEEIRNICPNKITLSQNLNKKIESVNISYWDANLGRMPLIAVVKNEKDKDKFEKKWEIYNEITLEAKKSSLYTLNEFVAHSQNIKNYMIILEKPSRGDIQDEEWIVINMGGEEIAYNEISQSFSNEGLINTLQGIKIENIETLKTGLEQFKPLKNINLNLNAKFIYITYKGIFQKTTSNTKFVYYFPVDLSKLVKDSFNSLKKDRPNGARELSIIGFATNKSLDIGELKFLETVSRVLMAHTLMANLYNIAKFERQEALKFALAVAVATIMSRNMSHNIGSHALAYLRMDKLVDLMSRIIAKSGGNCRMLKNFLTELNQFLDEIQECFNKLNLSEGYNWEEIQNISHQISQKIASAQNLLKNIIGSQLRWGIAEWVEDMKVFLGYLQHRMDFLAQISTEWPEWTFSAYLMKDIMRNFLSQRHLLDGIAKSEDLRGFYYDWEAPYQNYQKCKSEEKNAQGRIKFHVFNLAKIKNNTAYDIWKASHNSLKDRVDVIKKKMEIKENNEEPKYPRVLLYSSETPEVNIDEGDIQIAIPGGIVGYHAFYVIIENVIRNAAKHSYSKLKERGENKDLEVVIEFTDDPMNREGQWLFRIYDNVSFANRGNGTISVPAENNKKYLIKWEREKQTLKYEIIKIEDETKETVSQGEIPIKNGQIRISGLQGDKINDKIKEEISARLKKLLEVLNDKKGRPKKYRIFPETDEFDNNWKEPDFDLVAYMNECLRHSIIKENGELDKRHWGMAEMKIAAGYLQRRTILEIGASGDEITGSEEDQEGKKDDFIIRAIESPIGTLGFEFRVRKPKEVGIVCYN